jgi:hypothetical protein
MTSTDISHSQQGKHLMRNRPEQRVAEYIIEGRLRLATVPPGRGVLSAVIEALRNTAGPAGFTVRAGGGDEDTITERDAVVTVDPDHDRGFIVDIATDPTNREAFDAWPRIACDVMKSGWQLYGQIRAMPVDAGMPEIEGSEWWVIAGDLHTLQRAYLRWLDARVVGEK